MVKKQKHLVLIFVILILIFAGYRIYKAYEINKLHSFEQNYGEDARHSFEEKYGTKSRFLKAMALSYNCDQKQKEGFTSAIDISLSEIEQK